MGARSHKRPATGRPQAGEAAASQDSQRRPVEESPRALAQNGTPPVRDCCPIMGLFQEKIPAREIVRRIVSLIPEGWQYSEIACVRAVLYGEAFTTDNYRATPWGQVAEIRIRGECIGFVEVCYLEERPTLDEGPFRSEERMLLNNIAREIERAVENEQTTAALVQAQAELDAVAGARNEFLANISHEIRTPMTAILGFTDILLENVQEPVCLDAAITIKRNGCYLLNLINNILDLSMLDAGKLALEKSSCSLVNSVADVASIMRVRAQMERLTLRTEFIGPIPETIVTDPIRMRQILINLVSNAIKYTDSGSVRLVTRLLRGEGRMPSVQFDVIDTGAGMGKERVATLFQPFAKADPLIAQRFRGPGLGLTITKRLVELLGGTIAVRSELGKGTTFTVTIDPGPLEHVVMLTDPNEAVVHRHDQPATPAGTMPKLSGRVLLVEDGPDNQRLIAHILRKAGAEVAIAENGQEAIDSILSNEAAAGADSPQHVAPFDVVLMDMQMPVLDGYGATRRLRSMGYTGPIVALTAHAMSQDRQKCLDAGCDEYLTKPVEQRRLLDTVADFQVRAHNSRRWNPKAMPQRPR